MLRAAAVRCAAPRSKALSYRPIEPTATNTMRTPVEYAAAMQRKLANMSATASSMRKQAPAGTIQNTIAFLSALDLEALRPMRTGSEFKSWLGAQTDELITNVFRNGNFGGARKVLNIFLKELHHNGPLAAYLPAAVRPHLEVPLDKHVAVGLAKDWRALDGTSGTLPRWDTIKALTPQIHEDFQRAAQQVAASTGICRADLDLKYWRANG
jgi:hypothetical protein